MMYLLRRAWSRCVWPDAIFAFTPLAVSAPVAPGQSDVARFPIFSNPWLPGLRDQIPAAAESTPPAASGIAVRSSDCGSAIGVAACLPTPGLRWPRKRALQRNSNLLANTSGRSRLDPFIVHPLVTKRYAMNTTSKNFYAICLAFVVGLSALQTAQAASNSFGPRDTVLRESQPTRDATCTTVKQRAWDGIAKRRKTTSMQECSGATSSQGEVRKNSRNTAPGKK